MNTRNGLFVVLAAALLVSSASARAESQFIISLFEGAAAAKATQDSGREAVRARITQLNRAMLHDHISRRGTSSNGLDEDAALRRILRAKSISDQQAFVLFKLFEKTSPTNGFDEDAAFKATLERPEMARPQAEQLMAIAEGARADNDVDEDAAFALVIEKIPVR